MADGTLQLTMPELIYLGQEASTSADVSETYWPSPRKSGVMSRARAHLFLAPFPTIVRARNGR